MTTTDIAPPAEPILTRLESALPRDRLRPPAPADLEEPRGRYPGHALAVAMPRSVDEVATILGAANATRTPIVPHGGGTGLVGGQTQPPDRPAPLLLSLEKMTAIRAVHGDEAVLVAEAGAVLHDVQAAAEAEGFLFPLSLASEGTCRIGGNLATNAGGVHVLRYGNARDLCLGLEAVLPDGAIWNGLKRLRKDNTGYDLKDLLVGSEGTLGVITAAALRLFPRPASTGVALLAVPDPAAALRLLRLARDHAGEAVSAFELIHRQGFVFLSGKLPDLRQPWSAPPDWSVLIELGLSGAGDADAALAALFEAAAGQGLATDGVIAQSQSQQAELWALRESIPEANRKIGAVASHDISLPLSAIPEFLAEAPARVAEIAPVRINCFGHLGDGNLHYNLFPPAGQDRRVFDDRRAALTAAIHDLVHAHDGSISAEHGIGRAKVADLERYGDPAKLAAMRAIKAALDPAGIMNPGAVLRAPN
ncbi:MAG: FAD-binding oxidoreductase [Rhodobacteraceae bacterium]|nr:FAD-binding oxidoreductase [Paracoccaceae bacterium]